MLKDGIATFDQFELWYWHAYTYAFRRVMLSAYEFTSPIDPEGRWYADDHIRAAERYYRKRLGRQLRPWHPKPSSPDDVREDCRKIPATQLTPAEYRLIDPEINRMAERARGFIGEAVARWRRAFRDKHTRFEAEEPPPARPSAALVDVPATELMARVGGIVVEEEWPL